MHRLLITNIYDRTTTIFHYLPRYIMLIWILFLLLTTTVGILNVLGSWHAAHGGEYLWVAQSIAKGHGYSIDANHRWMFIQPGNSGATADPDAHFSTAIVEPVYTLMLASAFILFGEKGQLLVLLLQVIAYSLTIVLVVYLGRKIFNLETGLLAGSILAIWPTKRFIAEGVLAPSAFVGFLIVATACLLLLCLDKVSVRRGVVLGLTLGIASLTLVSTLLLIPISILLVLVATRPLSPVAWKTSAAILLAASVIILPWTVRNYLVFNEFVPVRTGSGLNLHQGNPILAATFTPGAYACTDSLGPIWKAENALDALLLSQNSGEKQRAIYRRGYDCIEQKAPEGYSHFNEAQRDKVYMAEVLNFIISEPWTFTTLGFSRFLTFFGSLGGRGGALVVLLALLGAIAARRNRQSLVLILVILAFSFPYIFAVQWFYRYRYPIEPMLLLLGSYPLVLVVKKFLRSLDSHLSAR